LFGGTSAVVMLGLIIGSSASLPWQDRIRIALDGVMIALALFVLAWPAVLAPTHATFGPSLTVFVVLVTGVQITTVAMAMVLLSRRRADGVNALTLLVAASGAFAVMAFGALGLIVNGGPTQQLTGVSGPMLIAELMLVAVGFYPMPDDASSWSGVAGGVRAGLPYVPVAGACAVAVAAWAKGHTDAVLVGSWFALVAVVLLRELLVVHGLRLLLAEVRRRQAAHDQLAGR
jgi:hypothetical protein